jgi:hypothetical protein
MLGRKWNLRQERSRAGAWRRQPPAAFQAGPCQPPVSLSVRGLVLARNPSERRSAVVVSPEGVHAGGGGGTSREGRGRAGTRGRCGGARRATHRECRYQKPGNTPARIRSRKQGRPARCSCGHFKFTLVQNCSLRSDPIRGLEYGSRILRRVRVA